MKIEARYIVAAALLFFTWRGATVEMTWPILPHKEVKAPTPSAELLAWAAPLKPILPKMTPADRAYLSSFYEAMAFVILRDSDRGEPIVDTLDKFVTFHSGSLRLAIDKSKVGIYPGLDKAIDETLINAVGADPKPLSKDDRGGLIAACGVLSYTFAIHHE